MPPAASGCRAVCQRPLPSSAARLIRRCSLASHLTERRCLLHGLSAAKEVLVVALCCYVIALRADRRARVLHHVAELAAHCAVRVLIGRLPWRVRDEAERPVCWRVGFLAERDFLVLKLARRGLVRVELGVTGKLCVV